MIEARGNRNALRMITQGTPSDAQQPMISLWRGSDGALLWKLKANGEHSFEDGVGAFWEMPGGAGGIVGQPANQMEIRSGTAGTRILTQGGSEIALFNSTAGLDVSVGGVAGPSLTAKHMGSADGGNVVFQSSGFTDWIFDNASGVLRSHRGGTVHLQLTVGGALVHGPSALATSATDGFPYFPGMTGTPTGTPTSHTGRYPRTYDSTNKRTYVYDGSWQVTGFKQSGAHVYGGTQSIGNSALTAVAFNSEYYDDDGYHDNATNNTRLTFAQAGRYHISCLIEIEGNATGIRQAYIRINGSTYVAFTSIPAGVSNALALMTATERDLNAGDYAEVIVYQNSGVALNVQNDLEVSPRFFCHRIK